MAELESTGHIGLSHQVSRQQEVHRLQDLFFRTVRRSHRQVQVEWVAGDCSGFRYA
jgi:hypothetical protein